MAKYEIRRIEIRSDGKRKVIFVKVFRKPVSIAKRFKLAIKAT